MSHEIGSATDFYDMIDRIDGFLTDQGHAFGLVYAGDGNGELTNWAGGASSVSETFTISMLSDVDFDVVGSVSGHVGYGTVGVTFSHSKLEFDITEGSQPFIAGDQWTISTSPAWTLKRRSLLTTFSSTHGTTGDKSFHHLIDGLVDRGTGDDHFELSSPTFPIDVEFEHETGFVGYEYVIAIENRLFAPTAWTLEYYEESSSSWQVADSQSGVSWLDGHESVNRVFSISTPVSATRWKWSITAVSNSLMQVGQFGIRSEAGGINRLEECVVWEAPGDDDDRSFITGLKPLYRADIDYYDLEVLVMDAWSDGSELNDQSNLERNNYVPLWDSTIDYWLVARGNGVRASFKIGTQYEGWNVGHLDAYFPPNEWPAPLLMGGSLARYTDEQEYRGPSADTELRFSQTERSHSVYCIAGISPNISLGELNQANQERSSCRVRMFDGTYKGFAAYLLDGFNNESVFESSTPPVPPGDILPYHGGFGSTSVGLEGTPVLFDVIVGTKNEILGEIPGVKAVSGDSVSAETTIPAGAIDYVVFPNITRTSLNEFYALALD